MEVRDALPVELQRSCRAARVGFGHLIYNGGIGEAAISISEPLLAFNGEVNHDPVIFLRLTGSLHPIEGVSLDDDLIVLRRETNKRLFTSLVGAIPPITFSGLRSTSFEVTLKRRYRVDGKPSSLVNISCPAGFGSFRFPDEETFSATAITATFEDGTAVRSKVVGPCNRTKR